MNLMLFWINADAMTEEKEGVGRFRKRCLDASDRFRHGTELERADARGSQQRRKHHVISRGDASNIAEFGVEVFHEAATGPTRA